MKAHTSIQPTNCLICEAQASCLHYNISSCNACKAFFRRCIVKKLTFNCRRNGNCDLTVKPLCKSCRFRSCVEVGMDPKWIKDLEMTDEVKMIVENAKNSKVKIETGSNSNSLVVSNKFDDARVVQLLSHLETVWLKVRESKYNPVHLFHFDVDQIIQMPCQLSSADVEAELSVNEVNPEYERWLRRKNWLFVDYLLCIDYFKAMHFFYDLDFNDQKLLIKNMAFIQATFIQGYYSYLHNASTVLHPDGERMGACPGKGTAFMKSTPEMKERQLAHFSEVVQPLYRVGPTMEEYTLLKTLFCCIQTIPGLSLHGQNLLKRESAVFSNALLRRLQARLGTMEGAKRFCELTSLIETYYHQTQKKKELHVYNSSLSQKKHPPLYLWTIMN